MHNFYSLTICMLHYNPQHVSTINMPILRRTNCIITASGIVTLCKWLYSMLDESRHVEDYNVTYILLMNKNCALKFCKWNRSNFYFNIKEEKPLLIWLRYVTNVSWNGYCVEIWVQCFHCKFIFSTNLTDSGLTKILHCGLTSCFNIPWMSCA